MPDDRERQELSCVVLQIWLRTHSQDGLTSLQLEHISGCDACAEVLVECGLSSTAEVAVPVDFAVKLCMKLPVEAIAPMPKRRRVSGVVLSGIVLLVLGCMGSVVFAAAPHGWMPQGWLGLAIEYFLVAEIVSLALWAGARTSAR